MEAGASAVESAATSPGVNVFGKRRCNAEMIYEECPKTMRRLYKG